MINKVDLQVVISNIRYETLMNSLRSRSMNKYLRIEYKQGCEVKGVKRYHIIDDATHDVWDPGFKTLEELNKSLQPVKNQLELFKLEEVINVH